MTRCDAVERAFALAARFAEYAMRRTAPVSATSPPPAVVSPYLTAREAAAYLHVSYGTFRNWATKISRSRTGRYHRDDLDRFARTRKK